LELKEREKMVCGWHRASTNGVVDSGAVDVGINEWLGGEVV